MYEFGDDGTPAIPQPNAGSIPPPGFDVAIPTLNLGHIHGGDNPNRICKECELHFDLRPLPGMQIEQLRAEIKALVTPIAEQFGAKIEVAQLFEGFLLLKPR